MNPNWKIIRKAVIASSILIACFAVFIMFSNKQEAKADINPMLNFTGKVTDSDSAAVADNVYDFSFGLYTTATSGTAIWSEDLLASTTFAGTITAVSAGSSTVTYTFTGATSSALRVGQYLTNASTTEYELITDYNTTANTVTVVSTTAWDVGEGINNRPRTVGGVVDIDLGSVSSLASVDFNQTLYLQVTFNSETMRPRKLITAVAQAFNADKLDGYDASDFANIADDVTVTGEWDFANVVGIATSSTTTALTVTQSGTGDIINLFSGSDEVLTVLSSGYVGIGTTTPYSKLSIWGSGNLLELVDTSSTTVFRVDDSGNLTITGTTTMGALTYPSYDGTAGQAILTDSNGNLYWGDSTGGGTVQTGLAGRLAFYPSGGIIVDDADYLFWDDTNDRLAIGTTSPYSKLTVWGDGTSGLSTFSVIDSASTTLFTVLDSGKVGIGTSSPSYQLDIYGGGNLLRVASSSGDLFTVTDSQITSGVPHSFSGSGDVDIAHNLYFSNPSAANIKSYGPLYITSGDPGTNTNLYLEGQGTGQVYVDDAMTITGSTTMAVWNKVIVVDGTTYAATGAGIQAAIDALPAEGGKVFIPEGTYSMTSTTTIPSNVWLEGAGASSTILYLADGANTAVLSNSDHTNGNSHIKISNLKIDGNDANNDGVYCHGIYFKKVSYSEINNIFIDDPEDSGIYLFSDSHYNKISDNIIGNGTAGIEVKGEAGVADCNNNIISRNIVYSNLSSAGIYLDSRTTENVVNENIIYSNLNGIYVGSYGRNTIVGNVVHSNTRAGIAINDDENTISGNTVYNNGRSGITLSNGDDNTITGNIVKDNDSGDSATYDGIILSSDSDNNIISSNRFMDNDRYEINISAADCNNNILIGNETTGSDHVGEINDIGTNTVYSSQLVSNDLILKSSGNIGIGTTSPYSKLTVWADGDSGLTTVFSVIDSASTTLFTILDNGYVGIGTSSPFTTLSVSGNVYIDGTLTTTGAVTLNGLTYTFPSSQTANYYLKTDGSGILSWVDVTSTTGALNYGAAGSLTYYDSAGTTATGTTGALLYWDDSLTRLGIGTTSPQTLLTVYKSTDDALISFGDANSNTAHWYMGTDYSDSSKFKIASSSLLSIAEFTFTKDGYLGIGATSPQAALHIGTASTSNLTTFNDSLFVSGELEVGETVYLGPMEFGANSGAISWIDMPVTSFAAAGTIESYTARIDNTSLLTIYAESDGNGGIQNTGVGIGTTTPFGFLSVSASSTDPALVVKQVDSGNQGPIAVFYDGGSEKIRIDSSGRVGIGTSSPYATLSIVGTAGQDNPLLQIATTSPLSGATTSAEQYFTVSNLGDTTINGRVLNPTHAGKIGDGEGGGAGAELTGANRVYVSGNYAYVTTGSGNSLEIVDISDPTNPTHAGKITDGDGGAELSNSFGVYVSGNYAYVAVNIGNSLEIVDISDPTNPTHAGKIADGDGGAELTDAMSVYVSGNYAYVVTHGGNSLEIVDISDPTNPTHAGKISDGDGGAELSLSRSVYVSGNYAYVVCLGDALEIVDISDPTNPTHAGKISDGDGGAELTDGQSVFVSGNYAYVAAQNGHSLEIVDISDPTNPTHAGKISDGDGGAELDGPYGVYVSGNYAYVTATGGNSLEIVDIFDPTNPTHAGKISNGDGGAELTTPCSVFISGNYAYVAAYGGNSLEIVDISGLTVSNMYAGAIKTDNLQVMSKAQFDQDGYFRGGLGVGKGILSQGPVSIHHTATTTSVGMSFLTVTATTSNSLIVFKQKGTGDILNIFDGETEVFTILDGGNVGIGTTGPLEDLSIYGAGYGDDQYFGLGVIVNRKWKFWAVGYDEQAGYGDYPLIIQRDMDDNTGDFVVQGDSDFVIEKSGNVGIGTSSPYSKLTVWGDGDSGLSAFSVIDSASSTLFTVLDNGYVGIGTASPSYNLEVVGTVSFGSDTGGDILFDTTTLTNQVLVGIGTSTPDADLTIVSDQVNANTYLFTIATSTSGSDVIDRKFAVDSDGDIWYDGSAMGPAADYAEYFYTVDTDLESGETVCVDIARNNAVKRCARGADGNVMGIVSTKPAIIGNAREEYLNNINYKIIGMLGQVQACVSNENGEIRPGDSLTSASFTPGCAMRAGAGDPTVGIALEGLEDTKCPTRLAEANGEAQVGHLVSGACTEDTECPIGHSVSGARTGVINVLISRRNKSLTVEMVEAKITDRIAAMEIEDEVQILISQAVDNLDLDSEIQGIVDEQMALFGADLTVEVDAVSGELMAIAVSVDELAARMNVVENNIMDIDSRLALFEGENIYSRLQTGIVVDENGNIKMGNERGETSFGEVSPLVAVVEIVTATTTTQTAFVVNQAGDGDVADFRADGVSVVNIGDTGKVTIIGEMLVDGRIMVCSGGACGSALDERVDETMGDLGVEGTVVAGAFEGYCEHGWIWVNGLAKYGTMPGFCVMVRKSIANNIANNREYNEPWTDISQGEAMLACQEIGDGYHLISENEWLTVAENIIRVAENDIDEAEGLQLATSTPIYANDTPNNANIASSSIAYVLSNGNVIYGLVGEVAEWTDRTVTKAGLIEPVSDEWLEYYEIENYNGFNIAPPYYYSSENGIGKIKTGDNGAGLRGFVRGYDGIYSLDLSYAPTAATSSIGFRCAR